MFRRRRATVIFLIIGLVVIAPFIGAQDTKQAEREAMYYRYLEFPYYVKGGSITPHWMADGSSFWFAEGVPENTVIWKVDPKANAKTPTLIHVCDGDPRVPKPQSDELHMALKKLGVPTEYIVYPQNTHGITDPRYQMVKMVSEFHWFEKWIKGQPGWFDWKSLLATLEEPKKEEEKKTEKTGDEKP